MTHPWLKEGPCVVVNNIVDVLVPWGLFNKIYCCISMAQWPKQFDVVGNHFHMVWGVALYMPHQSHSSFQTSPTSTSIVLASI